MGGHDDPGQSLTGLWGILTAHRSPHETLGAIVELALHTLPAATEADVTMLAGERTAPVVVGTEVARVVEELQQRLGEGPSVTAVQSRDVQVSGSLGGDPRWPRLGPRLGRMGLHSALSLPLLLPSGSSAPPVVVGAMTLYASGRDVFSADDLRVARPLARPAAVLMRNARTLADAQRLAEQLQEALTSRKLIDQAIGILMARTGADPERAFDRLRTMSQSRHVKVVEVARTLLDEAVRSARARRAPDEG